MTWCVPIEHVDDNRLYRTLDQLLPHKAALETHLKQRLGELFGLEYDLLLYDVTSTYFEGEANANHLAQRGYLRMPPQFKQRQDKLFWRPKPKERFVTTD